MPCCYWLLLLFACTSPLFVGVRLVGVSLRVVHELWLVSFMPVFNPDAFSDKISPPVRSWECNCIRICVVRWVCWCPGLEVVVLLQHARGFQLQPPNVVQIACLLAATHITTPPQERVSRRKIAPIRKNATGKISTSAQWMLSNAKAISDPGLIVNFVFS